MLGLVFIKGVHTSELLALGCFTLVKFHLVQSFHCEPLLLFKRYHQISQVVLGATGIKGLSSIPPLQ